MDKNLKTYNARDVVNEYNEHTYITTAEKIIFEEHKGFLSLSNLLDIGIGGGRTTRYLLRKCKKYIGIDYSEQFVNSCRLKFPGVDISQQDARDLLVFDDNTFDFVNFSFNGIDYADAEGRNQILSEVKRILKPNGIFFFSTHNKSHPSFNKSPWLNKKNGWIINIKTFIKLAPFFFRKMKNRKTEVHDKNYSILNDYAHGCRLLTFYTTPDFLHGQLSAHGFSDILFYNKEGRITTGEKLDEWISVTCRKP